MATLCPNVKAPTTDMLGGKEVQTHESLLNAFIPNLVRRRTGAVPSLRRICVARLSGQGTAQPLHSPPPPYHEAPTNDMSDTDEIQDSKGYLDGILRASESKVAIYILASENSASGVRWKHVGEGCRLIQSAGREAAADQEDTDLARKMYIDGLGYLLKALPDLSLDEKAQLSAYLPEPLRASETQQQDLRVRMPPDADTVNRNNWLYQLVAIGTMYGVFLATFLLPILGRSAAAAYRYDQRYRISGRIAESTMQAVSSVAKRVVRSLEEGKGGQLVFGLILYTISNASRGVADGYEKAISRQDSIERAQDQEDQVLALTDGRRGSVARGMER